MVLELERVLRVCNVFLCSMSVTYDMIKKTIRLGAEKSAYVLRYQHTFNIHNAVCH